jgi:hypothetical protein
VGGGHTRGRWATGGPAAPRRGSARGRPPENLGTRSPTSRGSVAGAGREGGAADVRGEGDGGDGRARESDGCAREGDRISWDREDCFFCPQARTGSPVISRSHYVIKSGKNKFLVGK